MKHKLIEPTTKMSNHLSENATYMVRSDAGMVTVMHRTNSLQHLFTLIYTGVVTAQSIITINQILASKQFFPVNKGEILYDKAKSLVSLARSIGPIAKATVKKNLGYGIWAIWATIWAIWATNWTIWAANWAIWAVNWAIWAMGSAFPYALKINIAYISQVIS